MNVNWFRLLFRPRGYNNLDIANVTISTILWANGNWVTGTVLAVGLAVLSIWGVRKPEALL